MTSTHYTAHPVAERDEEHERVLSAVFDLSPSQSSTLSCLVRASVVSPDDLGQYTGVKSLVKIVVSRTRKKLAVHGFTLRSKPGVGYWIEPDDKRGIEKVVSDWVGE